MESKIKSWGNTRNEQAYRKFISSALNGKRLSPLKAIRLGCLECNGFQEVEVRECQNDDCVFYKFRMGRNSTGRSQNKSYSTSDGSGE